MPRRPVNIIMLFRIIIKTKRAMEPTNVTHIAGRGEQGSDCAGACLPYRGRIP
jgi:hypothetical protein